MNINEATKTATLIATWKATRDATYDATWRALDLVTFNEISNETWVITRNATMASGRTACVPVLREAFNEHK